MSKSTNWIVSAFVLLAACIVTSAQALGPAMDLTGAGWIWTSEATANKVVNLPVASRAFRKEYQADLLKAPTSIEVLMAADDGYTLFVNGDKIGAGTTWREAQYFCVKADPLQIKNIFGGHIVLAVNSTNSIPNSPAGLVASVRINYLLRGSDRFVTDGSWVWSNVTTDGFQNPLFDSSKWSPSVVEQAYGGKSWGNISIPTSQKCPN